MTRAVLPNMIERQIGTSSILLQRCGCFDQRPTLGVMGPTESLMAEFANTTFGKVTALTSSTAATEMAKDL
jgi:hypothetical protein